MTTLKKSKQEKEQEKLKREEQIAKKNKIVWDSYLKNWDTPFTGGPKRIGIITGNTDTSDRHSALQCQLYNQVETPFSCWKEFAEWHKTNFDDIDWSFLFSHWEDDDDPEVIKEITKYKNMTAEELLKSMVCIKNMDPILFVTEDNPLFYWLSQVRGY